MAITRSSDSQYLISAMATFLDADGCAFNRHYFSGVCVVIKEHGHFLKTSAEKTTFTQDEKEALRKSLQTIKDDLLSPEMDLKIKKMHDLFYGFPSENFSEEFKKLHQLNIDPSICDISSVFTDDFEQKSFELLRDARNKYIYYMNKLDGGMLHAAIVYAANKPLINHIIAASEQSDYLILASASNRGSFGLNQTGMKQNGTGSIFHDLYYLREILRTKHADIFAHKPIYLNPLLMADVNSDQQPGTEFNKILNTNPVAYADKKVDPTKITYAAAKYDHTKYTLIYALAHDMMCMSEALLNKTIPIDKIKLTINYFEDRSDILKILDEAFTLRDDTLAKQMTFNMIPYNGALGLMKTIVGRGDVDYDYAITVRRLLNQFSRSDQEDLDVGPEIIHDAKMKAEQRANALHEAAIKEIRQKEQEKQQAIEAALSQLRLTSEVQRAQGSSQSKVKMEKGWSQGSSVLFPSAVTTEESKDAQYPLSNSIAGFHS